METAKAEIIDKIIFDKIKASVNPKSYVECGLCGAIRVEANEVARVISSFIDHHSSTDENMNNFYSDFLNQITESEPVGFENHEEYEKWKADNEDRTYHVLDNDGHNDTSYGIYDELVIFYDPTCNCFGKDKIKEEIIIE